MGAGRGLGSDGCQLVGLGVADDVLEAGVPGGGPSVPGVVHVHGLAFVSNGIPQDTHGLAEGRFTVAIEEREFEQLGPGLVRLHRRHGFCLDPDRNKLPSCRSGHFKLPPEVQRFAKLIVLLSLEFCNRLC